MCITSATHGQGAPEVKLLNSQRGPHSLSWNQKCAGDKSQYGFSTIFVLKHSAWHDHTCDFPSFVFTVSWQGSIFDSSINFPQNGQRPLNSTFGMVGVCLLFLITNRKKSAAKDKSQCSSIRMHRIGRDRRRVNLVCGEWFATVWSGLPAATVIQFAAKRPLLRRRWGATRQG
jgi:hypothetical protein